MTLNRFLNYFKKIKTVFFFFLGSFLGCLLLFLLATTALFWIKNKYQDRVYPNVYLFSTPLVGKNSLEVEEFLEEREKDLVNQKIIFLWQNNGEKKWQIIPQMINFTIDKEETKKAIFLFGKTRGRVEELFELYKLLIFPQEISPKIKFNQEKLAQILAQMREEVDRPAQDALFEFKAGPQSKVVNFQPSKEGKEVDGEQVKNLILYVFNSRPLTKPVIALELPVKLIQPKINTADTNTLGIKEFLGEGESFFLDSIPSRVHNIVLASSYLHGVVIPPGETFSFSEKIGDISAKTGYQPAYVIKERKTILEDGGGVCQVSTTLFRAALAAGLPIVERQAHYYRVGYYEQGGYPPGLDATVYPPSPDLKFKNDTPAYLLIQTKIDQERKRLAFEIYGTSDGRRVETAKPIIHSQVPPPEPMYIDEPSLPLGVIKRIDVAHWGAKVSFVRKVWSADGGLKEEQTFWSNYTAWPAVYQKGTRQ